MPNSNEVLTAFAEFVETVRRLRAPDGCPWDREQTHRSLVPFLIEESFELAEAIESGSDPKIAEELGDVLLQVVLHAQIASETGRFNANDVARGINKKMIRRHPHVFGDQTSGRTAADYKGITSDQVLKNWQEIKSHRKKQKTDKTETDLNKPDSDKSGLNKPALKGVEFRFDVSSCSPCTSARGKRSVKKPRSGVSTGLTGEA
jgi:MazG family protein